MKKAIRSLIQLSPIAFVLLGLTSCGDIENTLVLRADGSGTLETSFDVGEMMSMAKGMGDMGSLNMEDVTVSNGEEKQPEPAPAPEEAKDPMQNIIDRVTDPAYAMDYDTMINLESIMPDSVKKEQKRMDLVKKMNVHLKSPANSASLIFGIVMDFKNDKELQEMTKYLKSMDEDAAPSLLSGGGAGSMTAENFMSFKADMKKGVITVEDMDYSGISAEFGTSADTSDTSENMAMLEMMFGNSNIKTTIHVPGEVTSCTNPEAILTKDNKVIMEYPFLDVIKKGTLPGYTIHFTPAKK